MISTTFRTKNKTTHRSDLINKCFRIPFSFFFLHYLWRLAFVIVIQNYMLLEQKGILGKYSEYFYYYSL